MEDLFDGGPCSAQLNAIHRISSALFAKGDVDAMLRETLEVSMQTADAEAGSILLYDSSAKQLIFRHALGPEGAKLVGRAVNLGGGGKCATTFITGRSDISVEGFDHPKEIESPTRSTLTTAIRNFGGDPIGVVQVLNKRQGAFDQRDRELLEIVAAMSATVIENAQRAEIEKQAALARIFAYFAHDLKTEAFKIRIALAISESEEELRTQVAEANDKMTRLSEAMNKYAQGGGLFEFKPNELASVVEDELGLFVSIATHDGFTIDLDQLIPGPVFPFDALFVGRAVNNLVNNAGEAIRMGGGERYIRVSTYFEAEGEFPDGGFAEMVVEDQGPGIPREKLQKILAGEAEPDERRRGSTGVGTRIVHDVAQVHGGLFLGESEVGKGTIFRIRLPLIREE